MVKDIKAIPLHSRESIPENLGFQNQAEVRGYSLYLHVN